MSIEESDGRAPVIIDPGQEGWAPEPKVTDAELLLYGQLAYTVRLLGQSAVAARDAYSLACKYTAGAMTSDDEEEARQSVQDAFEAYEKARGAHREVACRATAFMQRITDGPGKAQTAPVE